MIKPKSTSGRPVSPEKTTPPRTHPEIFTGGARNSLDPEVFNPDINRLPGTSTPIIAGSERGAEPRIVVTYITDPLITEVNARLAEITLPGLQAHTLKPHETAEGLFTAPDGKTYAYLEEGSHYQVELNADGVYQIPWPEAPGVSPPVLKKIEGLPQWRIEAPWYTARDAQENTPYTSVHPGEPQGIFPLPPELANTLPAAHESADGIRKGPRDQLYVDLAEGTFLVRRNGQGEYKLASESRTNVPDITVEQTPGQFLWRVKRLTTDVQADPQPGSSRPLIQTEEIGPGQSKRARPSEDPRLADPLIPARPSEVWKSWGSPTKPVKGDAVYIDGLYIGILSQPTHATDTLAYIKHPFFSAPRFEAFEYILLTTPNLQPRVAVRSEGQWANRGVGTWAVLDGVPFEKSLTQYVSDQFGYLSHDSAKKVAREMFQRANEYSELSSAGVQSLSETFRFWKNRPTYPSNRMTPYQGLSDPLMLLATLPKDVSGTTPIPLSHAEGLQRIDIDPNVFHLWQSGNQNQSNRDLYRDILRSSGYQVSSTFRNHAADALLIQQYGVDSVFILFTSWRYGNLPSDSPVNWLTTNALKNRIRPEDKQILERHLVANKIIYLAGTGTTGLLGEKTLFISRIE
jgi:hypothetical protein